MMWWEQAGIDLTGVRERAVADTDKDGGEQWRRKRGRLLIWDNGREITT